MTQEEQDRVRRSMIAARSNAQGHCFEDELDKACKYYADFGVANVEKTPERFRVLKKARDGTFTGRFTGSAQPDYKGTLDGGRSVVFDAKFTTKDRIGQSAVTDHQRDELEKHHSLGALAGICVGTLAGSFFVPWEVWRSMGEIYGRKYMKIEELKEFEVRWNQYSAVLFLSYKKEGHLC